MKLCVFHCLVSLCALLCLCFLCFQAFNEITVFVSADELLEVIQPLDLKSQFPNGIRETPALFGIPSFRSVRTGILIYGTADNHDGCSTLHPENSPQWKAIVDDPKPIQPVVLLLDRGNCTFVHKVRNAEFSMGKVVSVIFVDDKDENGLPYMADDGNGQGLTTPSMLISRSDGEMFKERLAKYPQAKIVVQVSYSLPRPDNRVEYEMWSTSFDLRSRQWKMAFGEVARALGEHAQFTPHFYTIPGPSWGCDAPDEPCKNQCTNRGRYCAADPEKDITQGWEGRDVVSENLRQACFFKLLNESNQALEFWRYWEKFYSPEKGVGCPDEKEWETSVCSFRVLDSLQIEGVTSREVEKCVVNSGNYLPTTDNINTMLDSEIELARVKQIFNLPQAFVNAQPYYGSLACPQPVDLDHCGLFQQICAGYEDGTQPQACIAYVGCKVGQVKDQCGVCGGDGTSCLGCDGVLNGKKLDVCGVCGGNGSFDKCGQCLQKDSPQRVDDEDAECPNKKASFPIGAMIIIVIALALIVGVSVYFYMKKQNNKMRDDIDSLLRQYLPLEGGQSAMHSQYTTQYNNTNKDNEDRRLIDATHHSDEI